MHARSFSKRFTYDVTRAAAQLAATICFQCRGDGRDRVPAEGGVLVCANHQSWLDPVLVGMTCKRRLNYLARESLFETIPFRWLIQWYDAIPIQRDGLGLSGIKETLRRLKRQEAVLIFPEGTRTLDGEIGPLRPGICALARRANVPLAPVAIEGSFACWPRGQRLPRMAPIWVEFGPPIGIDKVAELDDDELLSRLDLSMRACHEAARRKRNRMLGHIDRRPGRRGSAASMTTR